MTIPGTPPTDRREAAVGAALAGAVVVVLGYASGIGLVEPAQTTTVQPPTPPSSVARATGSPDPAAVSPVVQLVPAPPVPVVPGHDADRKRRHQHPEEPSPSPTIPPAAPEEDCGPGLLESLPVVGSVGETVSSVLEAAGGTAPLLGRTLTPPPSPEQEPGVLSCVTGTLVGFPCCDGWAARERDGADR